MPVLERAQSRAATEDWKDDLGLELARCRLAAGDPEAALALLTPLIASTDDQLRTQARSLAGRSLVEAGRWEEASEFLAGDASLEGSWLHAVALARLGRDAEALAAVEDRIVAGDSLANWVELFRAFGSRAGDQGGDALRARLAQHGWVTDTVKQLWDLTTAQAMMSHDSAVATLLLERIVAGPRTPSTMQARLLIADRLLAQAHDDSTLFAALTRIGEFAQADPSMQFMVQGLGRWGAAMRADLDSTAAGAPEGDMMLFYHAAIARDSLRAPALASWLLERLERDWPESPYVPKALLARMVLEPDSLEALRARFESHTDSPYLAFVNGTEGPRFAELEWTLDFYLGERFAAAIPTRVEQ